MVALSQLLAIIRDRFDRAERRLVALERDVKKVLARVATFLPDKEAGDVSQGSAALSHEQIVVVKIVSEDPARTDQGIYLARIQKPTAFGEFEDLLDDDSDDPEEIFVRGYPVDSTGAGDVGAVQEGHRRLSVRCLGVRAA